MACGHGKLWWKGAGRLGMREGCREARARGPGPHRGLVRLSQLEAEVVSRRQSEHPWNPATANAKSRDECRSGQREANRWFGALGTFSRITPRGHTLLAAIYKVPGTPTLGIYQPRALCAVAPLLLPGLRSEETFGGDFGLPPRAHSRPMGGATKNQGGKPLRTGNGIREQNTLQKSHGPSRALEHCNMKEEEY